MSGDITQYQTNRNTSPSFHKVFCILYLQV